MIGDVCYLGRSHADRIIMPMREYVGFAFSLSHFVHDNFEFTDNYVVAKSFNQKTKWRRFKRFRGRESDAGAEYQQ